MPSRAQRDEGEEEDEILFVLWASAGKDFLV